MFRLDSSPYDTRYNTFTLAFEHMNEPPLLPQPSAAAVRGDTYIHKKSLYVFVTLIGNTGAKGNANTKKDLQRKKKARLGLIQAGEGTGTVRGWAGEERGPGKEGGKRPVGQA